jgi:hypothetical protein
VISDSRGEILRNLDNQTDWYSTQAQQKESPPAQLVELAQIKAQTVRQS